VRQAASGGDHGNQYTGGKVAVVELIPQPANSVENKEESTEKSAEKNKARDQAGKAAGVSGKMIDMAEYVAENAPAECLLFC